MTPLELQDLIAQTRETEVLQFKEARVSFDKREALRYAAALANEGGGHLVLGVTDAVPREIVGTRAFRGGSMQDLRLFLCDRLRLNCVVSEILHSQGRVVVIAEPSRPAGSALEVDGAYRPPTNLLVAARSSQHQPCQAAPNWPRTS